MNPTSHELIRLAGSQLLQVTMLALLVALVVRLVCRHRPHLAYMLWLLVVIKCLTPPLWSSPAGVFSWALLPVEATPVTEEVPKDFEETKPRLPVDDKFMDEEILADALLEEPTLAGDSAPMEETHSGEEPKSQALHPVWIILSVVWLVGMLVLAAVVAVQWVRVWRIVCRATTVTDEALLSLTEKLRRQLGVRGRVSLKATNEPIGPAVFGLFRPVLLLPEQLLERCSTDHIEPVLAHELMHIRRCDPLAAVLQVASQVLWWFHPLVWWVNRRITQEREHCCDEQVLASLEYRPAHYAHVLLDVLQENVHRRPVFVLPAAGGMQVNSNRLEHIMKLSQKFHRRTPLWCWAFALLVAIVVLPGAKIVLQAGVVDSEEDEKGANSADESDTTTSKRLHGSPSWFSLGGEVGRASDRFNAQQKPLEFLGQPRWFHGFSRFVTKPQYERWRADQIGLLQQASFSVAGEPLYPLPNRPKFPEKLADLITNDRGVRLRLSVRPARDNSLAILATLSTKKLLVFREVEHRWTNVTPLLFALYSDGKAITRKFDGFSKNGGTNQFVDLAEPDHPHTWRLTADERSLFALLPHRRPQQVTIVAAFAERQQTGYFKGDAAVELSHGGGGLFGSPRIGRREMILVRSESVTLGWTGSHWKKIEKGKTRDKPRPADPGKS